MSGCKKRRIFSLLLAAVLAVSFLGTATPIVAEAETSESAARVSLIDFSNTSVSGNDVIVRGVAGASVSTSADKRVEGNAYSLHWNEHTTDGNQDFYVYGSDKGNNQFPSDWSGYESLEMQIYSENATNAKVRVIVLCTAGGYFYYDLTIDWTGWKTVTLKMSDAASSGSPSWDNIYFFRICAGGGWGLEANAETDLYIASLDLVKEQESLPTLPDENAFSLIDFSDTSVAGTAVAGASVSTSADRLAEGNAYSLHWNEHTTDGNQDFYVYGSGKGNNQFPSDWSGYESLEMQIYSENATNATVRVIVLCTAGGYFYYDLTIDWTGWKTVTLKMSDAASSGSPSWDNIYFFRICAGGSWSLVANAETDLYIASLDLLKGDDEGETTIPTIPTLDGGRLIDFNDANVPTVTSGGVASTEHVLDGYQYSVHWNNHTTTNKDFYVGVNGGIESDWSPYDLLEMTIYSEKATNAPLKVMAFSPNSDAGVCYYVLADIKVDWTGWKTFEFYFSDANRIRQADWENIESFRICAHESWSLVGSAETDLYIGELKLAERDYSYDFLTRFYKAEVIAEAYSQLAGNVAVYAGGTNVVTEEGVQAVSYTFGWKDEIVTVPVEFFKDFFGAEISEENGDYSIKLGDKEIGGTVGETSAVLNGVTVNLTLSAYEEADRIYVSAAETAELLGLYSTCDNKLLVVGTSETVKAFGRVADLGVNELGEIVAYLAYHDEVNTEELTAEHCAAVKKNWVRSLVGDANTNDMTDSDIKIKIDAIQSAAKSSWNSLVKDENADELFEGFNSINSGHVTDAYSQVYNMALAYGCYVPEGYCADGEYLYHNEELLNDIIYALDWLKENRYNSAVYDKLESASWTVTGFDNWWDWAIGAPSMLIPTLILVEDRLTPEQISGYLEFFDEHVPLPRMTGANYTDMAYLVIGSALLQNKSDLVISVQNQITKTYLYVDDNERFAETMLSAERQEYTPIKGAGFFTDGSYILHTLHPQLATYGPTQFGAYVEFITLFADTKFEMKIPFVDNVLEIFQNSYENVIFDGKIFRWTLGRVPEQNTYNFYGTYADVFRVATALDEASENKIYEILRGEEAQQDAIISKLPIAYIKSFKEMLAEETEPAEAKAVNKVFYNMDKVVQKNPDWALSVSMSSSRIFNYECINNQNMDGWYTSDGRTEYYIKGSNVNATQQNWYSLDKYRLPGTTVDTQERKAVSIHQGNEYLSSKDFVGGVTLGDYGISAMELESYHNETDYGVDGGSYGGLAPAHQNDLTAKKAYFMFNNEVVCLGTAVNASDNNNAEVLTIVENLPATKLVALSEDEGTGDPYTIVAVSANITPEAANTPENTLDGSYNTKYAGNAGAEITWDVGEVKTLGFIDLSFASGSTRYQYFKLEVSADGNTWTQVFDGQSSGTTEYNEYFDLQSSEARYVKYINLGNSAGHEWVSITECQIYPPNADGTIGIAQADKYGADTIIADGNAISIQGQGDVDVNDVTWMNAAGTCGYVFPTENTANRGNLYARWTKGNSSCFELWFSHGVNPTDGGYAYILLPGQTAEETQAYAANTNIEILANNNSIQAVKDTELGITGIVFWEAGSFAGITVDKPCMVVFRELEDGTFEIAVSDPTQKVENIHVTVEGKMTLIDADECATVEIAEASASVTLNTKDSVGRSMAVSFEQQASSDGTSDGTGSGTGSENDGTSDGTGSGTGSENDGTSDGTDSGTGSENDGTSDGTDSGTGSENDGTSDGTDSGTGSENDGTSDGTGSGTGSEIDEAVREANAIDQTSSPGTGDGSNIAIWVILLVSTVIACTVLMTRKNKREETDL